MSAVVKWIGGSTLVALVLIGAMMFAGNRLEAQQQDNGMDGWLTAEDVLSDIPDQADLSLQEQIRVDPAALAAPASEPIFVSEPVVQDVPAYNEDNPFVIRRILPIEGPIRYGEWHWDDEGVPDGPLVITVDLQARVISVFRNGYEIGAAAALLGTRSHPTPTGTFPILTK